MRTRSLVTARIVFGVAMATAGCLHHPMPPAGPPDAISEGMADAMAPADLAASPADAAPPLDATRVELDLDRGWRFHKGDVAGAPAAAFDDTAWAAVDVPHTWNNVDGQAGGNAYYRGIGWYRHHVTLDAPDAGQRRFLQFDGADLITDVYVNGQLVGQHRGGYARFRFDVTALLAPGDNVVAVKVSNAFNADVPPLDADYTFFGGLYRDVLLLTTSALHVSTMDYASPGVYLRAARVTSASAELQLTVKAQNDDRVAHDVVMTAQVLDAAGRAVATLSAPSQRLAAGAAYDFQTTTTLPNPHLWNAQADPYLYRVVVELGDGQRVVDRVMQPLGVRAYTMDPQSGLSLNGHYLDVHGVNRHQDRLGLGWAIGDAHHDEDFALIEEMGASAIRAAHYQHAQHFYDLADQRGMIVWAEIPLIDYISTSAAFRDNTKQQLVELIRQNYNHPSIFWWSISNEITLKAGPDPTPLQDQLGALAKAEDASRPSTLGSTGSASDLKRSDLIGFNKYYGWYYGTYGDVGPWADMQHATTPTVPFCVSEYGAGASVQLHSDQPKMGDHTEEYQALYHEAHWRAFKSRPFVWGKFVWNMFDFASSSRNEGDTPGRNDKGLVTYDRKTRKDAFYFYKANWTHTPFVYIAGRRFTPRTQAATTIKVYGTMDSVELKLNGASLGRKSASDGVYLWPGVTLAKGANHVEVIGTRGAVSARDAVDWTLN